MIRRLQSAHLRSESGILMIELLIAIMIVALTVTIAATVFAGAQRATNKTTAAAMLPQVADRALDDISTDRIEQRRCSGQWNAEERAGQKMTACPLPATTIRDADGRVFRITRTLSPTDDTADSKAEPSWDEGVGIRVNGVFDHNFNTRDYFTASVTVTMTQASTANLGDVPASARTFSMARRIPYSGVATTEGGTLYFTACEHYRADRAAMTVRCRSADVAGVDPTDPAYRQGPFCDPVTGRCGFAPPIPGAKVTIERLDLQNRRGNEKRYYETPGADEFGSMKIENVPAGEYRVKSVWTPRTVNFEEYVSIPARFTVKPGGIQEVHVTMNPEPTELVTCFNMVSRDAAGGWSTGFPDGLGNIITPAVDASEPYPGQANWYNDPEVGAPAATRPFWSVNTTNFLWKELGSPVFRIDHVRIDTDKGTNCTRRFNDPLGYERDEVYPSNFFFEVEQVITHPGGTNKYWLDIASVWGGTKDNPNSCTRKIDFIRGNIDFMNTSVPYEIRKDFYPETPILPSAKFAFDDKEDIGRRYNRETVQFMFNMFEDAPTNRMCLNFVARKPVGICAAGPGDCNPPEVIDNKGRLIEGNELKDKKSSVWGG